MMVVTKRGLPRRTLLRGLGATLALPLLDSMVPALSALRATPARGVRRMAVLYVPNGMTNARLTLRRFAAWALLASPIPNWRPWKCCRSFCGWRMSWTRPCRRP